MTGCLIHFIPNYNLLKPKTLRNDNSKIVFIGITP